MHDDGVANCHLCHSRLCWDTVVAKTHCESLQQYLDQQGDVVNPNRNSGDDEDEEWCGDVFATYWVKHQALSSHPERVKHYQLSQGSFWSGHIPLITLIKCHKGHTPIGILCICVFNNGYSLTLIPLSHIVTTSIVHILHFLDAIDISYFCPRLSARFWPQALFAFWPILMGGEGGRYMRELPAGAAAWILELNTVDIKCGFRNLHNSIFPYIFLSSRATRSIKVWCKF